jgi:cystathionine beta-lyase/cystathionine gamma-synthase
VCCQAAPSRHADACRATHADLFRCQGPEARAKIGIKDSLVRFSVGVEAFEDIWADVEQALDQI